MSQRIPGRLILGAIGRNLLNANHLSWELNLKEDAPLSLVCNRDFRFLLEVDDQAGSQITVSAQPFEETRSPGE